MSKLMWLVIYGSSMSICVFKSMYIQRQIIFFKFILMFCRKWYNYFHLSLITFVII